MDCQLHDTGQVVRTEYTRLQKLHQLDTFFFGMAHSWGRLLPTSAVLVDGGGSDDEGLLLGPAAEHACSSVVACLITASNDGAETDRQALCSSTGSLVPAARSMGTGLAQLACKPGGS